MKKNLMTLATVLTVGVWATAAFSGDEKKDQHAKGDQDHTGHAHAEDHGMPMTPVPITEHHKRLHIWVGDWNVKQTMWMGPEPTVAYGREVTRAILDGRAVVYDYETTGDEGTFRGHGLTTWNVAKQRYEGTWIDIMSFNGTDTTWGNYDANTQTYTFHGVHEGPDGQAMNTRMVMKMQGKDQHTLLFFMTGSDGSEMKLMELVYSRAGEWTQVSCAAIHKSRALQGTVYLSDGHVSRRRTVA